MDRDDLSEWFAGFLVIILAIATIYVVYKVVR